MTREKVFVVYSYGPLNESEHILAIVKTRKRAQEIINKILPMFKASIQEYEMGADRP